MYLIQGSHSFHRIDDNSYRYAYRSVSSCQSSDGIPCHSTDKQMACSWYGSSCEYEGSMLGWRPAGSQRGRNKDNFDGLQSFIQLLSI